mmetsp:Transcript_19288/g.38526  ORF Transcript_19288/g.38526 Transcript_19288/m.38526 type:complete len:476 (+) Transcript_19288:73-1500(+)
MSSSLPDRPTGPGDMGWVTAGFILFGFAAPAAAVGVPSSIGAVGLVFGPVLCVAVTAVSALGSLFLHHLCLQHKVDNLPDLGRAVKGGAGFKLGFVLQQTNFFLYLPVALLCVAEALRDCIDPKQKMLEGCTDYWIFIVAALCFATTQMRDLSNVTAISFTSLGCVIAVILSVFTIVADTPNPFKQDASWIGNPDMTTEGRESTGWTIFMLGATTTAWAYVPSFLTAELSNSRVMEYPSDFPKAIALSALLNCVVYIGVGLFVVLQWGWKVNDPLMLGATDYLNLWPSTDLRARALNLFWFVACLVSYALDSIPLGRQCQRYFDPNFDITDFSPLACFKYMLYTLPTFILAVVMAILVPSLFCMLAFMTALTVPWVNCVFPAYLYKCEARNRAEKEKKDSSQRLLEDNIEDGSSLRFSLKLDSHRLPHDWSVNLVSVSGYIIFIACAYGAVGKLATAELRGPVVVGCQGWLWLDE